jgi:hypothetical protein
MAQFRKKPVVIEAVQWSPGVEHPGVITALPEVTLYRRGDDGSDLTHQPRDRAHVMTAHEQRVFLEPGDWIIPEPMPDRFYPCKPDIFAATYEPV